MCYHLYNGIENTMLGMLANDGLKSSGIRVENPGLSGWQIRKTLRKSKLL
jgi:hypothetical protein